MCLVAPSGEMIWQLWQFQVKAQWILVILMLLIVTPVIGCYCKFIVIRQIGADVTMVATINKQNCKIYKKIMFSGAHARLQSWYMISFYEYLWSSLAHCSHRGLAACTWSYSFPDSAYSDCEPWQWCDFRPWRYEYSYMLNSCVAPNNAYHH